MYNIGHVLTALTIFIVVVFMSTWLGCYIAGAC